MTDHSNVLNDAINLAKEFRPRLPADTACWDLLSSLLVHAGESIVEEFAEESLRAIAANSATYVYLVEGVSEGAVYHLCREEYNRAHEKHNGLTPYNHALSDGGRLVVLAEEIGEVARALTYDEGDEDNLVEELIQVATVALAWLARVLEDNK